MIEPAHRAAYLRELGIEQWLPRALPNAAAAEPSPTETAIEVEPAQIMRVAPVSVVVPNQAQDSLDAPQPAAVYAAPERHQLQDAAAEMLVGRAAVDWQVPAGVDTRLAVLGIDARGSHLAPRSFEQDWDVLQKMLAAISLDLNQCAVGGLTWRAEPANLAVPYALLLVDSGDDSAYLHHWQDKTFMLRGARAVMAPHPCMFARGSGAKRQTWNSLKMLQRLWTD